MLMTINSILITAFMVWIFSGQNLHNLLTPYDSWRMIEVMLLIWLANQLFFIRRHIQLDIRYQFLMMVIVGLMLYSSYMAFASQVALTDAILYLLLFSALYVCTLQANRYNRTVLHTSKIISLVPLFSIIFLPLSIWQQHQGNQVQWYGHFPNYRMFDDALLPCLFLVWFWQSITTDKIVRFSLSLVAILYSLSFLLNGARANLLAILTTLFILIWLYRQQVKTMLPAMVSMLFASGIYVILKLFQFDNTGSSLIRTSSSGRIDLWIKSIQLWLDAPILGLGGGNFIFKKPHLFSAHPHNFILQWLVEWGVSGFAILAIFIYLTKKIYDLHQKLPIFLVGFFISFLVNMLFSGTMVYPLSQLLNLWGFMVIFMVMLQQHPDPVIWTKRKPYLLILLILFSSIGMILLHLHDITAEAYWTPYSIYPPRFWLDGTHLHLQED